MLSIHPQARTTPAVRREIARSHEPTGVLAQRYGVSTETVRKWRQRGVQDCQDRSSRPHTLPWKASEEERAIVCALRRATGFPLDDLTFVIRHFLPHLDRDNVYRILRAEGLGRLPPATKAEKKVGTFKAYELGFVHLDIKHLPKLRTADGECRKRYLFVAISRRRRLIRQHSCGRPRRPSLPFGASGGQGRRDRSQRRGLSQRGTSSLSLPRHPRAERPRQLLHRRRLREGLPGSRHRASQDQALHAPHQRHGRALQRPRPARA